MYGYTVHVKRFVVKVSQEARSSSVATNHQILHRQLRVSNHRLPSAL